MGYSPQCHVGVSSQAAEIRVIEPLTRRAAEAPAAGGGGGGGAAPAGGSPAKAKSGERVESGGGGGGGGGGAEALPAAEGASPPPPPAGAGAEIEALRTGDRALITFKYCDRPEYLRVGDTLLFREGRCKGVGRIVQLLHPHGVGGAPA